MLGHERRRTSVGDPRAELYGRADFARAGWCGSDPRWDHRRVAGPAMTRDKDRRTPIYGYEPTRETRDASGYNSGDLLSPPPPFSGFNFFSSVETRLRNSFMTL
jgi:hypothetical protein